MDIEKSLKGTTLDTRILDTRYITALIFSIYEGLVPEEKFTVVCSENPKAIMDHFAHAMIQNIQFHSVRQADDSWALTIDKTKIKSAEQSCCGVCGIGKEL